MKETKVSAGIILQNCMFLIMMFLVSMFNVHMRYSACFAARAKTKTKKSPKTKHVTPNHHPN